MENYPNLNYCLDAKNMILKRKRIAAALAVGSFMLMGALSDGGVRLFPSEIKLEQKSVDELTNPSQGNAQILTERFLEREMLYERSHRSGNTIESIDEAVKKGANIIDMDTNDVNGEIYGEHGLVVNKKILGADVVMVFDPNEGEITVKKPNRFEELIKHIASLSTDERPLAVNIELKHGPFNYETLKKLIGILLEYQVPAFIQPRSGEILGAIRTIYNEEHTHDPSLG